jgi:tRNA(fMet)-specific endonuclease VapC
MPCWTTSLAPATVTSTTVADYLLDTNHASKLMAGDDPVASRVRQALDGGDRFGLTTTVLGELYYAVYASQQQERNLDRLLAMIAVVLIWPYDESAANVFGLIRAEQRAKGQPIPPMDAQIAAVCRVRRLTILTDDRHFQFVSGLEVQNWLR